MKIIFSLFVIIFMSLVNAETKNSTEDVNLQYSYLDGMKSGMSMEGSYNHVHADCVQCLAISGVEKFLEVIFPKIMLSIFMGDAPYISFVSKVATPPPTV